MTMLHIDAPYCVIIDRCSFLPKLQISIATLSEYFYIAQENSQPIFLLRRLRGGLA